MVWLFINLQDMCRYCAILMIHCGRAVPQRTCFFSFLLFPLHMVAKSLLEKWVAKPNFHSLKMVFSANVNVRFMIVNDSEFCQNTKFMINFPKSLFKISIVGILRHCAMKVKKAKILVGSLAVLSSSPLKSFKVCKKTYKMSSLDFVLCNND